MRMFYTAVSAICALALFCAGCFLIYYESGIYHLIGYMALCALFYPLSVILHEFGHFIFGSACKMKVKTGKISLFSSTASSRICPLNSRNVRGKLIFTALGGIVINALFAALGGAALAFDGVYKIFSFVAPSSLYLFILNAVPFRYGCGKSDMLIVIEAAKKEDCSLVLQRVLEIQGMISEGLKLRELDEDIFYSVPQIAEDEIEFIMLISLRLDYYKDKGDENKAAEWASRLESLKVYLPQGYKE